MGEYKMLITKSVECKVDLKNIKYYQELGYKCSVDDIINVKVEDLRKSSNLKIEYECDECHNKFQVCFKYFRKKHEIYDKVFCCECANKQNWAKRKLESKEFIANDGFKKCNKCLNTFPANVDYFGKKKASYDGFNCRCKVCCGRHFTDNLLKICEKGYIYCKKCDRKLPHTYQYFPADKGCISGLRNVCRECNLHYGRFLPDNFQPSEKWRDEDLNKLKEIYPYYTNEEIVEKFFPNRTVRSIGSIADSYNFTGKSEEVIKKCHKISGEKTSVKLKGKIVTDEQRKQISRRNKEYYKTHKSPAFGTKLSEERKLQISKRMKGKWAGKNNPKYGLNLSGELNPNWQGGITNLYQELRSDTKDWFTQSGEFTNYKCVITGLSLDNIHHIKSFKDIVEETFNTLGFEKKQQVSDYHKEDFDLIRTTLKDLHNKYGLGACVIKDVHKLFHDKYGYTNFSQNDFLLFMTDIKNNKYNNWFEENNIQLNFSDKYYNYLKEIINNNCN